MTVRNLEFLFHPKSVAVVFEPDEPSLYAEVLLRNLAAGAFPGPVIPVSAKKRSLFGIGSHISIDKLDCVPELAVICAAPGDVPEIVSRLGAIGTRAVIVGPAMRHSLSAEKARDVRKAILEAARPHLVRVLGSGSGGLAVPSNALNASLATVAVKPGKIALVTQSSAISAAVLERASSRDIGFSSMLHLGSSIDVDLADALNWLAADPATESILVQFDVISGARKFMSAARAAARNKPVMALRGGGVLESRAPAGAAFTADAVYSAALRRAGWVSLDTLDDLFETVGATARVRPMPGDRMSIMANSLGLGRLAADTLLRSGGRLSVPSPETEKQLRELLRTPARLGNPLVLPANISAENWASALELVLADSETDAVLTVCSPSPFTSSAEVATAISKVVQSNQRNVFTCWVGGTPMLVAQRIAEAHGVFSHDSLEKAIAIFQGAVHYERNRQLLVQMPPSIADDFTPNLEQAHGIVAEALARNEELLPPRQARRLLRAYGITTVKSLTAKSAESAIRAAEEIGFPVDLSLLLSNDSEFEQSASGLRSPADIQIAIRSLRSSARVKYPSQRLAGYRLKPATARSGIAALRLGAAEDALFGPVIFLGPASSSTPGSDCVVALPPLNHLLAKELVARSRFTREVSGEQREALESVLSTALVRLSQMLTDIDEVVGVELDPLHVEASGVVALDACIRIQKHHRKQGFRRFAIRPYPKELEKLVEWGDRKLLIRPIRPEDEATFGDFIASLDPEDSRMRFFTTMKKLPRSQLARFTQIDYDREMALVAIETDSEGVARSIGEVRAVADPDNLVAEFAIVVSSNVKGKGLGRLLLQSIIDYSRNHGLSELRGETLTENHRMQRLAKELGFKLSHGEQGTVELCLDIKPKG